MTTTEGVSVTVHACRISIRRRSSHGPRGAKIELASSGFLMGFGAAAVFTMWGGRSRNAAWAVACNLYGEGPLELTLSVAFLLMGAFAALKADLLMRIEEAARHPAP